MPRRRKDIAFDESFFNNMEDYEIIKGRLFDLACGCFNFKNMPDSVYIPYVVKHMIMDGKILAFRDDDIDEEMKKVIGDNFFLYQFVNNGKLDYYMQPTQRKVVMVNNGAVFNKTKKDSVIIRTNVSGTSLLRIIEYFARNIYLINRTIQININAQKTPVALTCDENQRLTYTNLLKQYEGNVPFIFGSKDLDLSQLKSINLNSPFVADRLYDLMSNYWNEFLTFFGIPNISINKKERLITDEVARTMGGILVARQNFENQIQRGFEETNKMFGTNIEFTWGVKPENEGDTKGEKEYNEEEEIIEEGGEN